MPRRGRWSRLTVEKKYEILQMIDSGASQKSIVKKYGIGYSTMYAIRSKREEIINLYESNSSVASNCTIILGARDSPTYFRKTLHQWYTQCTEKDINVTNAMLRDKAQELNAQFGTNYIYKGSLLRWVTKFKEYYDFSEDLENQYDADISKAEIRKLLQDGEYTLDNVYNADSATLMWKAVPEKTLLFEKSQSRGKMAGEQVTIFLCANATGCHKLPIGLVNTTKNFPSINSSHTSDPSIINKTNTKPFTDSSILHEWFNKCFFKFVTERQQKIGRKEKTLLLLNNASLDQENRIISTKNEIVKIMYYSQDAGPPTQPMDCGIITCFKRMYRQELLESLMPKSNTVSEEELIHTYSQLNIDDCCRMVHSAWSKIKNPILKNAWNKLLKDEREQSSEETEIIKKDIIEALAKLNRLPGCGECDSIAVMNWFETDKEYNTDIQDNIQDTLLDFINTALDTEADVNFEKILNI